MSQQHDDEGTVIRPRAAATAVSAGPTSPAQTGGAAPSDPTEDGLSLRIGTRVSEFEITQRIGEGGFSIVYLAMDHSLERIVALKEYMPSSLATRIGATQVQPRSHRYRDTFEAGLKSFVNEAKLLAQFDHPSLVKVYRFWEANGTAYMVMPFYQGITVKEAVRALPQPPDEAWLLTLLDPLTEALLVIHAEHCYHRDIAPDNVILLANGARPLLLDFGAARRVIGDMTQALTVILKAGYAPVEQYAEVPGMKQGPWTDVYALAAVVYWAITGKTPPASVGRMLSDSFVPLAACAAGRYSARFVEAIDRALVVRPEQRTPSIEALRRDLGLDGAGTSSTAPSKSWDDSDATVIRPLGREPGSTTTQRRTTTHAPDRSVQGAEPPREAPSLPPTGTHESSDGLDMEARHTRTHAATATPSALKAPAAGIRPLAIAASVIAAAALGGGVWWAVREPPASVSTKERPAALTAEKPPIAETPVVAPSPSSSSTSLPTAQTGTGAPMDRADDATKPPMTADQSPPIAPVPEAPALHAEKTAPRAENKAKAPESDKRAAERVTRSAPPRPDSGAAERAPGDTHQAECARIFQRLSLGESSPDLLERAKTLKCR